MRGMVCEHNHTRSSMYALPQDHRLLPSPEEEWQMIMSPAGFAWPSKESIDGAQVMLDEQLSLEDVYKYAGESCQAFGGVHCHPPHLPYSSMPHREHEQQWRQQHAAGLFDAHAIFQGQNDDDLLAMVSEYSFPYQARATSPCDLGECAIGDSFTNSSCILDSPGGSGSPDNKPRTYMQWVKRQRRTQQRAARRRSDAAAGRFNCQVPGCGKKYSSSGGIRYHLRNCEHEGLPQTASSLAQLAEARAKEDAAIKRKETTTAAAEDAAESDEDRSPQDASYDEAGISEEGDLLSHSPAASPLRPSSTTSSPAALATINAADVEFSFDLFDDGLPTSLPWQRYQQYQVTSSLPSPPASKTAFSEDASMMCLDGLGHAHLRASDSACGCIRPYGNHQVPSSPRSLMSAFEATSSAEGPMLSLFEGL